MMQSKSLLVIAGTTLGLAASAFAQNPEQRELLADASSRTSFQGGGSYSGNGFNIQDASGNNRLTIGGYLQFRYALSFRDDQSVGDTADVTNGFSTPITRLRASGTVGTKELGYKIQTTYSQFDGVAAIDDAFATWDFGNGWQAKWGQFNLPVVREISIGAEEHLGADFSIGSQFFGQGYSQGIQVGYTGERVRAMAAFSDGAGTANTNFDSALEADYALSFRVEGLLMGTDWEQFNNYTSWRSASGDSLLLGGAVHWQDGGETNATTDQQVLLYTLDASWEGPGYNVTAAFYGRNLDPQGGTDRDDFGGTVQGGLFLADNWEVFARWDGLFLDKDAVAGEDVMNFLGVGVNYYLFADSNAAKFTAQVNYAFDDTTALGAPGSFLANDGQNGFLGDSEEGEFAIIGQMHVAF
jgi:hypothetical protein